MKKLIASILVVAAVVGVVYADTATVTNELGQVFTVTTSATGVTVSSGTLPAQPASASASYLTLPGIQLDAQSNTTTTTNSFTPRQVGDILIGQEGSTGKVWIAVGVTKADWKPIYDP